MSFLNPLGLLGLLAIPIIIIIYILRSRYKNKNVSSTFIWKRSMKYVKRKIPLNFIMSLLLILQILTVVVASFAIARPTIEPFDTEEQIIILDASASMLADNGGKTRFEEAKEKIEEAADEIGANHQITLILAGTKAKPVVSRETDKGKFLTALNSIECGVGSLDVSGALSLAGEVLNKNKGAKISFYTDKSYIDAEGIELVDCKRKGEFNVGIIGFSDNELVTGTEFVADIGNYGLDSSCSVKLYIDNEVVAQKTVDFKQNEIKTVRFTHSSTVDTGDGEIRVKLSNAVKNYKTAEVRINSEDSFTYDDSFVIYPRAKEPTKIMYISTNVSEESGRKVCNSLLYIALRSAGYEIDSDNMYHSVDDVVGGIKGFDLYIFEGVDYYELPDDGAVWLLNTKTVPESTGLVIDNQVYNSNTMGVSGGFKFEKSLSLDTITEITKNVDLSPMKITLTTGPVYINASVTEMHPIAELGTFKPVYTAGGFNVMAGGSVGGVRMIVSTFDFAKSSLGAFVSDFPLLVKNMVDYSMPDPLPQRTAPVGSTVSFSFPAGAKTVTYKYNDTLVSKIDVSELKYDIEVDKPGKYEFVVTFPDGEDLNTEDDERTYTLTGHISEEESIIVQRVPNESIAAPEPEDGSVEAVEPVEIFPYLIGLLIILLIIEWGVYYREQY